MEELLSGARDAISARRVFGDPIEHDGVVIVPAAAVSGALAVWSFARRG